MKINDGHYYELLDRIHVMIENIDNHLVNHPLSSKDKKIKKQLNKSIKHLSDAYQYVGNLTHDFK